LFVIPPLFIITAVIFQQIWRVFKKKQVWFSLLAVAAILPGVYWNVVLHPYEYIYYNSLVGGVSGAFRDYESDYWCTSYKAAMEYVNQVAPQGATVAVYGPISIARIYARLDLNLVVQADNSLYQPDLVVLSSKWDHDLTDYPQVPVVFSVVREDAVLVVVKNTSGLFSEQ
jgi:4-amino-4-deoxy-L-arabinose transferase-like glycosyltransferase